MVDSAGLLAVADLTPSRARQIRFGPFELDVRAGELRKHGIRLHLREQPFQILLLMLEHPGEIVMRGEIRRRLWPNETVVEFDHGINNAIRRLREALGESAGKPRYIETVGRRGYRFLGEVQVEAAASESLPAVPDAGPDVETDDLGGKPVSHYLVLDKLGRGGMGVVFRANDLKLNRHVALKFLPEEFAKDPRPLERFQQEACAAAALNHPNICTIYEIGEHQSRPFIAMELLEGKTLKDLLAERPVQWEEILELGIQIAGALEAAHQSGIVHRDIKPANLFVTQRGQAKILDFGLAKLMPKQASMVAKDADIEEVAADSTGTGRQTGPSSPIGTVAYMSPEQIRGEELDARTDLFSFGVVLYEMATGRGPFQGNANTAVFQQILSQAPIPPLQLRQDLPVEFERIIQKALEKNRRVRYQEAAEILADLQCLKRGLESSSAARKPAARLSRPALVAGTAALVITAAVSGRLFYSSGTHTLSDADTIVLADFANSTGDAVFDDTLKQALATEFQQSPHWNILPERKETATLKLMGRSTAARIDAQTALDLCQRAGSKAVLAGSIARMGSQYAIGLNAINCETGGSLERESVQAAKKEGVLDALGAAARKMRGKLGESLKSVQRFDTRLEQATTPSLEALQAYSRGRKALIGAADYATAVSLFQQAIRIDPNFAMAYLSLGLSYASMTDDRFTENVRTAYELRDRVSEWERLAIESRYCHSVTGNLLKARQTTALWAQTYPRDAVPANVLGEIDFQLGQYDSALAERREAVRLDPGGANLYIGLVGTYCALNRLEEARAAVAEAQQKKLDSPILHELQYLIGFLQDDVKAMQQQTEWFAGTPGMQEYALALDSDRAAYLGQLRKARTLTRQLLALVGTGEAREKAAIYETEAALREAVFGNNVEARQHARAALRDSTIRDVEYAGALALAFAGEAVPARTWAGDLAKRFPEDTIVQFVFLPTIRGLLSVKRNDAVEILRAAAPYEFGDDQPGSVPLDLYPVYVRGQAYLAAHRGSEAATEFEKIIGHRALVLNSPIGALAHVGLARAHAIEGDMVKARISYRNFLTLWKDADAEIPILREAKAEYQRIKIASPHQGFNANAVPRPVVPPVWAVP